MITHIAYLKQIGYLDAVLITCFQGLFSFFKWTFSVFVTLWWCHQIFSALLALCAENSPVNSPHKGQWHGALMFSLICVWTTVEYTIETPVIWDAIAPIMTSLWCMFVMGSYVTLVLQLEFMTIWNVEVISLYELKRAIVIFGENICFQCMMSLWFYPSSPKVQHGAIYRHILCFQASNEGNIYYVSKAVIIEILR